MFDQLDVCPSFGRDYTSKEFVLRDWNAGKDFMLIHSGQYTSIRDIPLMKERGITALNVRYGKLRKKLIIELGE